MENYQRHPCGCDMSLQLFFIRDSVLYNFLQTRNEQPLKMEYILYIGN
jgi:hypothetical protein